MIKRFGFLSVLVALVGGLFAAQAFGIGLVDAPEVEQLAPAIAAEDDMGDGMPVIIDDRPVVFCERPGYPDGCEPPRPPKAVCELSLGASFIALPPLVGGDHNGAGALVVEGEMPPQIEFILVPNNLSYAPCGVGDQVPDSVTLFVNGQLQSLERSYTVEEVIELEGAPIRVDVEIGEVCIRISGTIQSATL